MAEADYAPLVRTRFALARALTGDRAAAPGDAAALATQALADFKAKGPGFEREARAVEVFLSSHSAK